jgi:hypothetical protein
MGEETGRKSALRRVKLTLLLAVILAISLAPAIGFQLFPRETLGYLLEPTWRTVGSRTGFTKEALTAIGIMTSSILAVVAGSALLLVLIRELTESVRQRV